MDIIYYCFGIAVVLFIVNYLWKRLPKDPVEVKDETSVAPYKVEPPVETVVASVVEPVVEVKSVVPELKVVTGSSPKPKKPAAKKTAAKTPVKAVVKKPVAKAPAKPRAKKPTDNA